IGVSERMTSGRCNADEISLCGLDKVFGEYSETQEVYDVAAGPVIRAAMEGINGTVFAYGVTSSGKTHTMHGDHNAPGIIPLAIKDVFSIIQDVINDLLDPTGQNLRVREDAQEEVVLSPGHALSFIAAGEGWGIGSNSKDTKRDGSLKVLVKRQIHELLSFMTLLSKRKGENERVDC
ncbi:kinesin-like protein KIN-7D, mitochondrial, partial [Tanacetum coccineum]